MGASFPVIRPKSILYHGQTFNPKIEPFTATARAFVDFIIERLSGSS
jgi:hypothetical protein